MFQHMGSTATGQGMATGSDTLTEQQRKFLTTHLGAGFSDSSDAGAGDAPKDGPPPKLLPIWVTAKEATNGQISALQSALKSSGLPLFEKIADKGLHGITSGELSQMQAALMDFDGATADTRPALAAKVRTAVGAMETLLASRPIELLDRNPLIKTVTLRATLGAAVADIKRSVG